MNNLAPIVLFVYNRPWHTEQTLNALMKNDLADQSLLYIYADGIKLDASIDDIEKIKKVRSVIRDKQWCKEILIVERENNFGLANSVISGVTEIINKYGRIIVLEDDLITSRGFLQYMNKGLDLYQKDEKVWQLSGFSFPIKKSKYTNSSFFLSLASSWGWATWRRAWDNFDLLATGYEKLKTDKELSFRFDLNGSYPYTDMLLIQMEKKSIDSWAIRMLWSIFKNEGLTLFPDKSLIYNIGYDKEATHTKTNDEFEILKFDHEYQVKFFPDFIDKDASNSIKLQHLLLNKSKGYFKIGIIEKRLKSIRKFLALTKTVFNI